VLAEYLAGGGRALILLDATQDNRKYTIEDVLSKYGITPKSGLVVETDGNHFFESPTNPGITTYPTHRITENLGLTVYFGAIGVMPADKLPDNAEVKSLLETTSKSWLVANPITGTTLPPKNEKAGDISGPISLGVAMKFNPPKDKEKESAYKTRLVVIGDSDFASNILTSPNPESGVFAPGNVDLFVNSINWLADRYNINAVPKDRTPPTLTLSTEQKRQIAYLVLGILPATAILLAFVVWYLRKRNKVKK
jgi:ABC-type uncharacterized transport system involved in gliding motility auxiliary subunit